MKSRHFHRKRMNFSEFQTRFQGEMAQKSCSQNVWTHSDALSKGSKDSAMLRMWRHVKFSPTTCVSHSNEDIRHKIFPKMRKFLTETSMVFRFQRVTSPLALNNNTKKNHNINTNTEPRNSSSFRNFKIKTRRLGVCSIFEIKLHSSPVIVAVETFDLSLYRPTHPPASSLPHSITHEINFFLLSFSVRNSFDSRYTSSGTAR